MKYEIKHNNYNNFKVYEINKLPPRAYFVPFGDKKSCEDTTYLDERYKSKELILLGGDWDFLYYERISHMPTDLDTELIEWNKIDVPSCWQMRGYDKSFYINARYMFDYKAPYVPADEGIMGRNTRIDIDQKEVKVFNSVGVYKKDFQFKCGQRAIISFLGVANALQLYINGKFVGYSEGSHNTAEFDLTDFLTDGDNQLVALVYKWCNGTYLECQDMFRHNGIFRDVYITKYQDNYIYDYKVKTAKQSDTQWNLFVDIDAVVQKDCNVICEIYDDNNLIGVLDSSNGFSITLDNIQEWNAEIPKLYTVYILIKKGSKDIYCVRQEIGFREIEIKGNVFLFNGKAVKLKGVNHHDTHPKNGFCLTMEEWEKEAQLMKELNINCVRTAHYPPDPIFLKIANYYGLYIVDEADIEAHGTYAKKVPRPNHISNNKAWRGHFWDRVSRMYHRDCNNVSVVMWSLGNESGGWKNQDYCYNMLKCIDNTIPIHYEGVIRSKRFCYDVVSQMYASTYFYEKYLAGKAPKKYYKAPYFQCEYAHAMGVGAGGLDFYMDLFLKSESLMGGCIWEWADHAILHEDGTYTYGGDHGEYAHDGNFCSDGLVYADRSFGSGSYNTQAVYRPIRASYVSNNKYMLSNTNYFRDSSYLDISWKFSKSGVVVEQGKIKDIIQPSSSIEISINHADIDTTQDCFINFVYFDKTTKKFVAEEQLVLCQSIPANKVICDGAINCIEENHLLRIGIKNGEIVFDNTSGQLQSYKFNGLNYDESFAGFVPTIFRPPIDNYRNIIRTWTKQGLDKVKISLNNFDCKKNKNVVKINCEYDIYCNNKPNMKSFVDYTVYPNGVIQVDTKLDLSNILDIPKYGLTIKLPKSIGHSIEYYGKGNKENYSDFDAHSSIGIFKTNSNSMYENNIKPQDSGNRSHTRWAKFRDTKGDGLEIRAVNNAFNFSVLPFDDETVSNAKHNHELKKDAKSIYLKVDGFLRGIGSHSCGEDTRLDNINSQKSIAYSFQILPIVTTKESTIQQE